MIPEAFAAIQRNRVALLIYVGIVMSVYSAQLVGDTVVEARKDTIAPVYLNAYTFAADLLIAASYALAQCIAFARIGRELDKPLWKVETSFESLKRFFNLWFILMLVLMLLVRLAGRAGDAGNETMAYLLSFTWFTAALFAVPFGSAIMFYGRAGKDEIAKALDTFSHQFPRMLLLLFVVLIILSAVMALQDLGLPKGLQPIISLVDGFGDCFIFACTWIVCMHHRDDDDADSDFDF